MSSALKTRVDTHLAMPILLLSLLVSGAPLVAQDTKELVIRVTGESLSEPLFRLTLEPGRIVDRAIRVYSEPSHTWLLLALDPRFKQSEDFLSWRTALDSSEKPMATVETRLPQGYPRVILPPVPSQDDGISVWIYGTWPDGTAKDRLIAEGKVGGAGFTISTYLSLDDSSKGSGNLEHCCSSTCCTEKCTTCSGPEFSCCVLAETPPSCCFVECGRNGSCGASCNC